jgi:hypothetical protein
MHLSCFSNTLRNGTVAGSRGAECLVRHGCYLAHLHSPTTTTWASKSTPLQGNTTPRHHAALTTRSVPNIPIHMESTILTRCLDPAAGDHDRTHQ